VGTGVLGPVFRARESDGDRTVAIKSFHLDLTPEQVEIFGNALAHIVKVEVSHPAIVAPLAAGLESGTPFMAYEYVAAESLDVALRRAAQPAEGLAWIAALAGAVDAAHALGLVHGALHLRDVLVTQEGVCATGFGIASALEHVRLGFPIRRPYTAPEVLAGHRWGPPADRFAVAALAYELLTGTRLSGSGDGAIADLRALRPDVADPAGLEQAFRNALAEDPDIRSASATGFVTALARAIGADAVEIAPAAALGGAPADADGFAAGFLDESPPEQSGAPRSAFPRRRSESPCPTRWPRWGRRTPEPGPRTTRTACRATTAVTGSGGRPARRVGRRIVRTRRGARGRWSRCAKTCSGIPRVVGEPSSRPRARPRTTTTTYRRRRRRPRCARWRRSSSPWRSACSWRTW
jgi:serine/threonine-protein kinase